MSTQPEARTEFVAPLLKKSRRKWLYGGIAVIVVLGIAVPVVIAQMNSGATVAAANTYQVGYGQVVENVGTSGTIEVPTQINLQFQGSGGLLKSLPVAVGQTVKAGQVLGTVDAVTARLQVVQAESGVAQAQGNLASAEATLTKDQEGAAQSQIT